MREKLKIVKPAEDPNLEGAERYVVPEDFPPGSVWRKIAEIYGVGPVVMLAWEKGEADKVYIPNYEALVKKGSKRHRAQRKGHSAPHVSV